MAGRIDSGDADAIDEPFKNIDDGPSVAPNGNAASQLAFEQRIQLLEALVCLNDKQRPPGKAEHFSDSLTLRLQYVVDALYTALENSGTDAFRRFLHQYDNNAALLAPHLPLLQSAQIQELAQHEGSYLSGQAKAVVVIEAGDDLKTLERELREIDVLNKRGLAGAGKLADCLPLQDRLTALRKHLPEVSQSYDNLERQMESLLAGYDNYVEIVSQLFLSWDDTLNDIERSVARIERERL